MRNTIKAFLFYSALSIMFSSSAYADEYHYRNILIGERASGMAGAYMAISDDPSGLYYNPAGVAYSTGNNLSASVNAYHQLNKEYKGVIGGHGWERESSSLLPNFFGIIQPLGDWKLGLSYAVPDSASEDQDQIFYNLPSTIKGVTVRHYVINFNADDNTYNFGPSIAGEVSDDLSFGLSVYYHKRRLQRILNQYLTLSNGSFEWANDYYESEEWGLRPVLGFMWSPAEKFSVGLSGSKTFVLGSNTKEQATLRTSGSAKNVSTVNFYSTDENREHPWQTGLGLAYFGSEKFLVSLDANYYSAVNDPVFGDRQSVIDYALGTEYYFSPKWAVRLGGFTNQSNTPDIKSGYTNQAEHIDLYGGTLSLSRFVRNTSVTLGAAYAQGSGEVQAVSDSASVQDAEANSWTVFLSSSYSY